MFCQMSQEICFLISDGKIFSSDIFAPILVLRIQVLLFGCQIPTDLLEKHKRPNLSHKKPVRFTGVISKMSLTLKSSTKLLKLCSIQQMVLIDCNGED